MDQPLPAPPAQPQRLVYLGSPEPAVAPLRALVDAGYDVALVVSRPDRRRGRGSSTMPSPVKAAALELGLEVVDDVDAVAGAGADLGVVVAYGKLIRPHLLARLAFVNLHFSLLPRWRGAAPVERAILAGDAETGVCVMALEEGLDTGGVYRRATVAISEEDTLEGLRGRLVEVGTDLLLDCLQHGFGVAHPQEGPSTYAAKIDPAELQLDWMRPALELQRIVRVGRAWTTWRGNRLLVHEAARHDPGGPTDGLAPGSVRVHGGAVVVATGEGALELRVVQPEGRGRLDAVAWRNGARPADDELLGR